MDCSPPGSSAHGIFQARILEPTAHILLQGIFLTLGLNMHLMRLLNWQAILYQGHHLGTPKMEPASQSIVLVFNLCKGHEKT